MSRRLMLVLPLLALAIAGLWSLSRSAPGVLCVGVSEGRVRLETEAGSMEVPAGQAAAGGRTTPPALLTAVEAGEEGWRKPLEPEEGAPKGMQVFDDMGIAQAIALKENRPLVLLSLGGSSAPLDRFFKDPNVRLLCAQVGAVVAEGDMNGMGAVLDVSANGKECARRSWQPPFKPGVTQEAYNLLKEGLDKALELTQKGEGRGSEVGNALEPTEPAWKTALRGKLEQTVHFKFVGIPFKDAKEYLETQGKVVINVDRLAQDAISGLDEMPIQLTSPEAGMSLESALNYLSRQVNLKWTLRDETITITTDAGAKEKPELRVYDVAALLGDPKVFKPTPDLLEDFIKELIDKAVWGEEGNSIGFESGKLFVTAPPSTQGKIRGVLKSLREFQAAKPPMPDEVPDEPAWKLALREKLKKTVHYKFAGLPFKEAKEYLETQGRVVINVDKVAQESQTGLDEISIHLTSPEAGMSLESALNALTRQVNLKWTLRDESVTITTEAGMKEGSVLRRYDVRDLLGEKLPVERLRDTLMGTCDPAIWSEEGSSLDIGFGAIYAVAPEATQAKLRQVLKELRR